MSAKPSPELVPAAHLVTDKKKKRPQTALPSQRRFGAVVSSRHTNFGSPVLGTEERKGELIPGKASPGPIYNPIVKSMQHNGKPSAIFGVGDARPLLQLQGRDSPGPACVNTRDRKGMGFTKQVVSTLTTNPSPVMGSEVMNILILTLACIPM